MEQMIARIVRKQSLYMIVLLIALALSISACGRKASPAFPDGATYPDEYPTE